MGHRKILTVVGARPQFVKAAVLSRALRNSAVEELILHTGQHYDPSMSEVFFQEMEIPKPAYNLEVGSASHGAQTGRMMEKIEEIMKVVKPAACLVYGDTNSTLAGALVAAKLHVPVVHVEAGLRSFNRQMPEEINRVLTDHVSDYLLCPTDTAVKNLRAEGLGNREIRNVGDVMYDAALFYSEKSAGKVLSGLGLEPRAYALMTLHRAENTDDPKRLAEIMRAVSEFSSSHKVLLPLHPRTRSILLNNPTIKIPEGLRILDPVGYVEMIELTKNASLVLTDSGGLQKEAFFFKVPCVTLRSETEWVELLELAWNRLADPRLGAESMLKTMNAALGTVGRDARPYGDGKAGEKIRKLLEEVIR